MIRFIRSFATVLLALALVLGLPAATVLGDFLDDAETAAFAAGRGEYRKAVYYLTRVIDSGEVTGWDLSQALTRRADALAALGSRQAALADYDAALALSAINIDALINRGLTHHEHSDFDAAIADFNAALTVDPSSVPALYNRALSYGAIGSFARSLEDLNAVLKAWPGFAQAYNDRGVIHSQLGDPVWALRNFDAAIVLQPDLAVAYYNRAVVHRRRGRPGDALADLDRALTLAPDDPEYLFMRKRVLFELDRAPADRSKTGRTRNIDPGLCRRLGENPSLADLQRSLCE